MNAVVVDSNVFKFYYEEITSQENGHACLFMKAVLAWGHIALDERGLVEIEWRETACGDDDAYFRARISARMFEDKIRLYTDDCHPHTKKAVRQLGVPKRDQKYIFLAVSSRAKVIFSEDIDMYEPKAKKWPEKKKAEIKSNGKGCVCKLLWDGHQTRICTLEASEGFFAAE